MDHEDFNPRRWLQVMMLACGPQIGQGAGRTTYICRINPAYVLKVEEGALSFQNINEWELWQTLEGTKHEKWVAPCHLISPDGSVLMQRRTTPIPDGKLPRRLPAWLSDFKRENFGMMDGRVVCHDYGTTHVILAKRAVTTKLKTVSWRPCALP